MLPPSSSSVVYVMALQPDQVDYSVTEVISYVKEEIRWFSNVGIFSVE